MLAGNVTELNLALITCNASIAAAVVEPVSVSVKGALSLPSTAASLINCAELNVNVVPAGNATELNWVFIPCNLSIVPAVVVSESVSPKVLVTLLSTAVSLANCVELNVNVVPAGNATELNWVFIPCNLSIVPAVVVSESVSPKVLVTLLSTAVSLANCVELNVKVVPAGNTTVFNLAFIASKVVIVLTEVVSVIVRLIVF